MTQPSRFCEQCGAGVGASARFCGKCGHPVAQPAQAAPPTPPAAAPTVRESTASAAPEAPDEGEPVVGVIAGLQRRKGLLGYQTWNLVVTPQRLVFALMTQQMMNDAVRQAQENAKREGKGLLARIAAQMGWLNLMAERYAAMPVDETLAEQPDNFSVPHNQVKAVKLEHREDRQQHQHSEHLILEAASGKYEFELKGGHPDDARQVLQGVLGGRVR